MNANIIKNVINLIFKQKKIFLNDLFKTKTIKKSTNLLAFNFSLRLTEKK